VQLIFNPPLHSTQEASQTVHSLVPESAYFPDGHCPTQEFTFKNYPVGQVRHLVELSTQVKQFELQAEQVKVAVKNLPPTHLKLKN
jgi:hypothetical protein